MAADLAISLATPFIEYLITPIRRQCGYILFYRSYLRDLEEGVDKLKVELEGIQHKCEAAQRNAMDIEKKVTNWIDGVNGAVKDADTLLGEQPGLNTVIPLEDFQSWFKRCVCIDHPVSLSQLAEQVADAIPQDVDHIRARKRSFYLNPVVCYKKGRKAKKTMLAVQELNKDKETLGDIFYEAVTRPILSAKDYESLESRKEIIENIISAFGDAEAAVIGVWGMGGVGKSTLMKEVLRLAQEKNLFDDVAMAVVSQNPDLKKIQGELAVWLGLKFKDDENVSGRASRLHKRLKPTDKKKSTAKPLEPMKQNRVLIILDDIWRGIDVEEIGIPMDAGAVKLLFTSRKQHVLSSEMGCSHNVFKLEVLKDNEPWRLFESIVGEIVGQDSKLRYIGLEMVEKCSGLPVVLKAIAMTLKNCSLSEWEDALVQFKGSKDAYSNLEISYRHLESEELKSLFLLCALTNDAHITVEDLLYYSMGLGLLKGTHTVRSARDKLKALLHGLQDSSLLLKDDDQDLDFVKMHDVVREVAIKIASRDQYSLMITDEFELKEIPRKKLKNSKTISIPHVNFRRLPEGWECPELRMFLLYRRVDDPPIGITDSFFEGMKELSVLDFTGRRCDSLPSSIQFLRNLNTLCLDLCSIEDLTIIGKLKQLQILTFIGSEIGRLPEEIGELSELRVLNLEDSKLEIIEPQVLGKLTCLEELHLKGSSFIRWEDEEEMQPSNAKVSELNNLSNLSSVNIHIHNPSAIPKHLEFGNLAAYIIQIGDVWDWTGDYKESRVLKIKLELCRGSFLHEEWVQDLLKRSQNIHLDGIKGWQRSIDELCLDGFQELKHLHLQNSSLVQCVAHSVSKWLPCTTFTVLESLFLEKLTGLETISRGLIAPKSFSKLKIIKVIDCGKLKNLFSYSMLKCISQLEEIEVRDCEAMQVIVLVDSVAKYTGAVKLEALRRIKLHNLPNIMTFCSNHRVDINGAEVKSISSEIVQEDQSIPTTTMFPNDQLVSFPLLKSLILSSLPKLKYIWQNNCSVDVAKLEYLEVSSCDELLIVIPSSLVKEVKNLETLMVRDCGSVQEVFETSDGAALNLTSDVVILSRLNNLELSNLPLLRHIWKNNDQLEKVSVFPNLNLLELVNCSSVMNLLPAALLKSLNQLTRIRIKSCKEMEAVVPIENDGRGEETRNIEFPSLVDVWLEDLPNMLTFVWTKRDESINFLSMKELYVDNCPNMRSFSLRKEDESAHELYFFDDKVLLPKLARLDLKSMSSIQKIWHDEILEKSFCQLEMLIIEDCQSLVDVIPPINMTGNGRLGFQNLKKLIINECTSLERPIFKFTEEMGKECDMGYYSLTQLKKLQLFNLPNLKHVVQPDSHVVVGFQSLVKIIVSKCPCISYLFPIATATTLSKLEYLQVFTCSSMRQIFGSEEEANEEEDEMLDSIIFPCLRSIVLQSMNNLISVFLGNSCMLCFPSLKALHISWCSLKTFVQSHTSDHMLKGSSPITKEGGHYLFDDKVQLPNLKKVELYKLDSLQTVWKTKLPCVSICDRIGQITEITIKDCENLEEIICESDNGEKEIKSTNDHPAVFHSLANVMLEDLPNMVALIRGRRDQSINFPCLRELKVESCPKMRAFYLPDIEESGGESLLPLCFFDHKALLLKLVKLSFVSVGSMEKIWHDEIPKKCCCQIEELVIEDCKKLVNIFPSNMMGGFQFQNLKKISVRGCLSLKGPTLFHFAGEEKGCKKSYWSLPKLETLFLSNVAKLEHVVEPTSHVVSSFPNLADVQIEQSTFLIDLFPVYMAPSLSKLEKLLIYRCYSMRQVFGNGKVEEEKQEMMMNDPILLFPCLRSIELQDLDNLISFFSVSSSVVHFPSLEMLRVDCCSKFKTFVQRYTVDELEESDVHYLFDDKVELPNLKNVILRYLSTLQTVWKTKLPCLNICDRIGKTSEITIMDCESLEKGIKTTDDPTVFHSLVNVTLENLPDMVAFIWGRTRDESINFPSLKELHVISCPKMRAFYLPYMEENGDESLPLCFFDHKVLLPEIVELSFAYVDSLKKIWHDNIHPKSFCQIEQLYIHYCQNLVNIFPSNMMVSGVRGCHFQNLKKISATRCTSLEHVVDTSSHAGVYSFPNLEEVEMEDNPSVIDLFPLSTAPTLSKLQQLCITRCGSMRQVFMEDKFEEKEEELMISPSVDPILLFPCLGSIKVKNLDNLVSFFSLTSSVLHFPSLEALEISWCPKLETFVQRYTTDKLEESVASKIQEVHYLFDDKVVLPNLKKMELEDLSSLHGIWNTQLPCLDSCDGIGQIINIKNCEKLEEFIFESEHGVGETKTIDDPAVFHSLIEVSLDNLPSMIAFVRARRDRSINFPSLKILSVKKCSKMRAFSFPNTEESSDESFPLCPFFDRKVLVPKVVQLDLISVGSIVKIWHKKISEESFFQLERLVVVDCQNLVSVFASKYVTGGTQGLRFQNLKKITIRECRSLQGSLFEFVWEGEEKGKQGFSLPQLEKLFLIELPKLEHVIHPTSDVIVEFQSLVEITVADCQCLIDLLPSTTAATLSKLEKVTILRCNGMRYVFGKEAAEDDEDEILLDLIISFPCLRTITVQRLNSLICFFLGTARRHDFPFLEDLQITRCPVLKTFVQRHESEDIHYLFDDKVEFPNLQKMQLLQLSSLQTIWKNQLIPTSSSCSKLKFLTVSECKDLQHIFPASFANNLAPLEKHFADESPSPQERFAFGGGVNEKPLARFTVEDGKLVVSFRELKLIGLTNLPSLTSFSPANCTFEFPSLEQVTVMECPNMMVFCNIVLAPKLSKVLLTKKEETGQVRWDGDLNATIQNLPK